MTHEDYLSGAARSVALEKLMNQVASNDPPPGVARRESRQRARQRKLALMTLPVIDPDALAAQDREAMYGRLGVATARTLVTVWRRDRRPV